MSMCWTDHKSVATALAASREATQNRAASARMGVLDARTLYKADCIVLRFEGNDA
jgi:hypothetical protein